MKLRPRFHPSPARFGMGWGARFSVGLTAFVVGSVVALGASGHANETSTRVPYTLAVLKTEGSLGSYAVGNGKFAWIDESYHRCRRQIRVLDLATGGRAGLGACDGYSPEEVAIGDGAIVWLTGVAGNTEMSEKIYSFSSGRMHRLASYIDMNCDEGAACGASLFEAGGHAYVSHGGTVWRVAGSALRPTRVSWAGSFVVGASWPFVALVGTTTTANGPTDARAYRLTDGRLITTITNTHAESIVLSSALLAASSSTPTSDLPRLIVLVYDLRTRRVIARTRDERAVAMLGRRVVLFAPKRGAHFRVHSGVALRRLVVRPNGGRAHLVAALQGDGGWSEQRGSRLYWVEVRYPDSGTVISLRTLDLAGVK
jgi:hypothetical protein